MSQIPNCPHCKKADFLYRNVRMFGWTQEYFDLDGKVEELMIDNLRTTNSKTLRCCSCDEIRRDVVLSDGIVILVQKKSN